MGTEILHPQDCLIERLRIEQELRPRLRSYHSKCNRKTTVWPEPKKRGSNADPAVSRKSGSRSVKNNDLVMGQVAILKRGQSLDLMRRNGASTKKGASKSAGSEQLWPEPAKVSKHIRIADRRSDESDDVYAGSAFFLSPSPRALPLPNFSKKTNQSVAPAATVDDSATKDLRRLLRLD